MPQPAVASEPWAGRRRRAEELLDRWPFAAEVEPVVSFDAASFACRTHITP